MLNYQTEKLFVSYNVIDCFTPFQLLEKKNSCLGFVKTYEPYFYGFSFTFHSPIC